MEISPGALALPEALLGDFPVGLYGGGSSSQMAMCKHRRTSLEQDRGGTVPVVLSPPRKWAANGSSASWMPTAKARCPSGEKWTPSKSASTPQAPASAKATSRFSRQGPVAGGQAGPGGTGRHWSRPPSIGAGGETSGTVEGALGQQGGQAGVHSSGGVLSGKGGPWSRSLPPSMRVTRSASAARRRRS